MASKVEIAAMRQAIAASALGIATTSPNPPVGCVIIDQSGNPVGVGYHHRKGQPHAEANALAMAGRGSLGGTAVVTLEPCNHVGVTPACRQLLIDAGIARVVLAIIDPTSRGEGGAAALRAAGVDVEVGLLADEALHVLGPWLTSTIRRRPFLACAYWFGDAQASVLPASSIQALRLQYDAIVLPDQRLVEGVPGGHGVGHLELPATWLPTDAASGLRVLYGAGARTVLAVGESSFTRSAHDLDVVDRVVLEFARDYKGDQPPAKLAAMLGFAITSVDATDSGVRATADRSVNR